MKKLDHEIETIKLGAEKLITGLESAEVRAFKSSVWPALGEYIRTIELVWPDGSKMLVTVTTKI